MLTPQMMIVLILSRTILVVADNSFVTEIPAKLKKAMDITVPENFDVDKMQILIDTLRGDNVDGIVEFLLHKKEKEVSDKTENK